MRWPRRPIVVPVVRLLWAIVAVLIVSLALTAWALHGVQERADELCHVARDNREAAIEDVAAQAAILVETSARLAEQDGRTARAKLLRERIGPAFVAEQRARATERRPPIDCSQL